MQHCATDWNNLEKENNYKQVCEKLRPVGTVVCWAAHPPFFFPLKTQDPAQFNSDRKKITKSKIPPVLQHLLGNAKALSRVLWTTCSQDVYTWGVPSPALSHRLWRSKMAFNLLFNFWGTVYKFMVPELKRWIFNQLNESNKKTPRMWPIYNQPFQENPEEKKSSCFKLVESEW